MSPRLKRFGQKAKELAPLALRRIQQKRSQDSGSRRVGLRKRLKRENEE